MNEFAEKYKALLEKHEVLRAELDKVIAARDEARARVEVLTARLQHLLESEYIRSFDALDPVSHAYVKDIADADNMINVYEERSILAACQRNELEMLKECIARMAMDRWGVS